MANHNNVLGGPFIYKLGKRKVDKTLSLVQASGRDNKVPILLFVNHGRKQPAPMTCSECCQRSSSVYQYMETNQNEPVYLCKQCRPIVLHRSFGGLNKASRQQSRPCAR